MAEYFPKDDSIMVEYILAVKILELRERLLEEYVFIFDKIECNLINIVSKLPQQLRRDYNLLEHCSCGTDFWEEDQVGLSLQFPHLLLQQLLLPFGVKILFSKFNILFFGFLSTLEMSELFLQSLQIVCDVVVLGVPIWSQPVEIVFTNI